MPFNEAGFVVDQDVARRDEIGLARLDDLFGPVRSGILRAHPAFEDIAVVRARADAAGQPAEFIRLGAVERRVNRRQADLFRVACVMTRPRCFCFGTRMSTRGATPSSCIITAAGEVQMARCSS